jgi:hypothetical protein
MEAIFAMPFFNENEYLKAPTQVWIWTVLTVVFTLFAFAMFAHIISRQTGRIPLMGRIRKDEESGEGQGIPLSNQSPTAAAPTA